MVEIVGVGFMKSGKVYYFAPGKEKFELGDMVIVETARGLELGRVLIANSMIEESDLVAPLKDVKRRATDEDIEKYKENLARRDEAMRICAEKIAKHGLDMKLIDAEFMMDGSKMVFYFSSEGRVDFRELAKDLAAHFKNRIELRQIGVRDEAKMIGGIGICGRPLCCNKWLADFQPVSIKMAKLQNLSLNPTKISGSCGRLMCCLNYENKTYKELRQGMPNDNERVMTPDGLAKVIKVDYFNDRVITRQIEKDPETGEETFSQELKAFPKEDIKRINKNNKNGNSKEADIDNSLDEEAAELLQQMTQVW